MLKRLGHASALVSRHVEEARSRLCHAMLKAQGHASFGTAFAQATGNF